MNRALAAAFALILGAWPLAAWPPDPGELAWIAAGRFTMGSPVTEAGRAADEVMTEVTLTQGFYLGRYEVRQREYLAVMGENPSQFTGDLERPVEQVSWEEASEYCARLTVREREAGRLPGGWEYRLPTEAQWEYACRAGTTTPFSYGASLEASLANFNGHFPYGDGGDGPYLATTTRVGSYPANAWGLYDLHGNLYEWCQDWYGNLPGGSVSDPEGPETGTVRVLRGGSWLALGSHCRSAYRIAHVPSNHRDRDGFRVALVQSGPVGKLLATVTLSGLRAQYDGMEHSVEVTTDPPGLRVTIRYAGEATAPRGAGEYEVVGTIEDENHEGSGRGTLVVEAALLEVKAEDARREYGAENPELRGTITGLRNGEEVVARLSCGARAGSGVGSYPIYVTADDPEGVLRNYRVSWAIGRLVVDPTALEVVAQDATRPYGGENPPFTGLITGPVNPERLQFTYTTEATQGSPEGTYLIVPGVVAATAVLANYRLTLVSGTLTVAPAFTFAAEPGFYVVGAQPVAVDESVEAGPGNELFYDGATLTVGIVSNLAVEDRLELAAMGNGTIGSGLDPSAVELGNLGLASIAGGNGTNNLILELAEGVTAGRMAALMRTVTFSTSNTNANERVIEMTLARGEGRLVTRRTLILNRPPVARAAPMLALAGAGLEIPLTGALANDFDVDHDVLAVGRVDALSQRGGTVRLEGDRFVYAPPPGAPAEDQFSYALQDGRGGSTIGTVRLKFVGRVELRFESDDQGTEGVTASMEGTAGQTFRIDASGDLDQWTALDTVTAGPLGIVNFRDAAPGSGPARFYRAVPIGP